MTNIKKIEIRQFRGIKQLMISNFSEINLIVGDNNSGKTTFLEAVQLLFTQAKISSVKSIIRQRTVLNLDENSFYLPFIRMFNVQDMKLQFRERMQLVCQRCLPGRNHHIGSWHIFRKWQNYLREA